MELLKKEKTLLSLLNYEIDLVLSPPAISEKVIDTFGSSVEIEGEKNIKEHKNTVTEEGKLNINIYFFTNGNNCIQIRGILKDKDFYCEKEYQGSRIISVDVQKARIKYVLASSRNILRSYYLNSNLKSIETHLTAYLLFL